MPYNRHNYRVNVPNRSGFDKSHRNTGTLTCGTLTPLLCDEVIPGSRVSLRLNLATQLPPLVSDTYMNLKLKAEAFFVPMRLCCGSFEDFFCDVPKDLLTANDSSEYYDFVQSKLVVPSLILDPNSFVDGIESYIEAVQYFFGPGSLMDYLGFTYNIPEDTSDLQPVHINVMPAIAYALVYQEWYRNPRVQKPLFAPVGKSSAGGSITDRVVPVANMPFHKYMRGEQYDFYEFTRNNGDQYGLDSGTGFLVDGSHLFDLRQRNFPLDYFTGARVDAQQGDAVAVRVDLPDNPDSFTIAQLRAANSLQQFRERNNIASPRLVDQVKARYGANLSDGVAQRPICIGSASYDVSSTGISQTGGAADGANPFSSVAAQYGRAYGSGSDFIISDFTVNEPGYILVNVSLVPEVTYSSLADKKFSRYTELGSITEMATPLLQNVGDQPIFGYEITGVLGHIGSTHIFGYQDRFADFMFIPNSAHGKMKEGQDLSSFVLQRFIEGPSGEPGRADLSSSFLEIPKDYLDGVFAVSEGVSGISAWYDCYLDYKVSMPLAEFSIPSLQDPAYEHGHSVSLRRNGQIF